VAVSFGKRLSHAWNAFTGDNTNGYSLGPAYGIRPDRPRLRVSSEKTTIASIYTKMAMDASSNSIRHVRLDDNERYLETLPTGLNNCLTLESNIDQIAQALFQDVFLTMFDKGVVAIVPVDTTINPSVSGSYDIKTFRVGEILQWYPMHIRALVYNEKLGRKVEVLLPKSTTAIIENPLYMVMNEPNSTLQRLIRKLSILDAVDEQTGAGKLDLIVQLPYVIKTEARRNEAEKRRTDIEMQLRGSKFGIAYTDGTERITQLNRPVENTLVPQIAALTSALYTQLGLSEAVLNGTAGESEMLNYYNRTIGPILSAVVTEMCRKFLTKTARSQKQAILYFRDPFKLVPVSSLAEIADKFTRNEILTSNEIRSILGYRPSTDPNADKLQNKNLNAANGTAPPPGDPSALPSGDPALSLAPA